MQKTLTIAGHAFNLKLTHDVLETIENRLYQRRIDAMSKLKAEYPTEVYVEKLNEVLKQYEDGDFNVMHSEAVQKFLQTEKGSIFLLAIMGNMTEKELLPLWIDHEAEFRHAIQSAYGISFPKDKRPAKKRT